MKRFRTTAALGLAIALVCLSAAPAAAAPRVEEPPRLALLAFESFADRVADLFGGWFRSVFAPTDRTGDPDG